jgi:hypothetical protein
MPTGKREKFSSVRCLVAAAYGRPGSPIRPQSRIGPELLDTQGVIVYDWGSQSPGDIDAVSAAEKERMMKKTVLLAVLAVSVVVLAILRVTAEEKPVLIKWKFVPGKQYVYEYGQQTDTLGSYSDGKMEGSVKGAGTITIVCDDDKTTAHVELRITGGQMDGKEIPAEEAAGMPPLDVRLPMLPDGTITQAGRAGEGPMQLLAELLFPLPPGRLTPGKALEQEGVTFAMGPLSLEGKGKFEYESAVKANELDCVRYSASYDMTQQEGADGDIGGPAKLKADSQVVFAPDAGYFISVKSRSEMDIITTSPMHGDEMNISMKNTISLRLEAVEDIPDPE